ncbi:helix-turn-helix domain-containing protein [Streptomyces alfalfae]
MGGQQYSAASVRELAAVVERIAPRNAERWEARVPLPGPGGGVWVSRLRARQLWMVVGMFDRAVRVEGSGVPASGRARDLLGAEALEGFWRLAEAGELRAQAPAGPLAVATLRIVRDCLAILADLLVPEGIALPVLPQAEPKRTVKRRSLTTVYRELVSLAAEGPLERGAVALSREDRTRLLAMVAVILDAAPRSGEMEPMNVDWIGEDGSSIRVVRAPQNSEGVNYERVAFRAQVSVSSVKRALTGREGVSEALRQRILAEVREMRAEAGPVVERYALREGSQVALASWLRLREQLVAPLEGAKDGLWVTIHASKAGPPGIRMRAQGIRMAYARGMRAVNHLMAGSYRWSPMPVKLEALRRSVRVEPLPEEE